MCVRSGDGGNGCVSFRREKHVDKGGPDGGNGGRGGNVWAVAESGLNSLFAFRNRPHWKAPPGISGTGSCCHGADGEDLLVPVPAGEPPPSPLSRLFTALRPLCTACSGLKRGKRWMAASWHAPLLPHCHLTATRAASAAAA